MNLLKNIEQAYKFAKRDTCCDCGCYGELSNFKEYVVLKGEKLAHSIQHEYRKMCDCCIFIAEETITILLVELKNTANLDDVDIEKKLTNGVEVALYVLKTQDAEQKFKIIPILLSKPLTGSPSTYNLMANIKIYINGNRTSLLLGECGDNIDDVLNQ